MIDPKKRRHVATSDDQGASATGGERVCGVHGGGFGSGESEREGTGGIGMEAKTEGGRVHRRVSEERVHEGSLHDVWEDGVSVDAASAAVRNDRRTIFL